MKTPKLFNNNLKNKVITMEMLEVALYSINKRAKNCRDKKNEYYIKSRGFNANYNYENVDKYKEQEQSYYQQKDFLIKKLLQPRCIHKESVIKSRRVRYYEYEDNYSKFQDQAIYENEYFDKEAEGYISFIDVIVKENIDNYYLFYKTKNYSFHIPISNEEAQDYMDNNCDIVSINQLTTEGKEITELLSIQFVNKLMELVQKEDFIFIP
jgi:hypothetical protein